MDLKTALSLEQQSFDRRLAIRGKKNADYATDDCLSNFKRVSLLLSTLNIDISKPSGVALIYALLKIDRLTNLVYRKAGAKPSNESILDTIDDLKNYIDLLYECLVEEKVIEAKQIFE